ncbi:MAG: hypothetical protein KAJ34_04695, partial [Thermodesulfovibrionia bacterium]|nr:hypothetical protein [Thermodesulfovibrionia bacterium]
ISQVPCFLPEIFVFEFCLGIQDFKCKLTRLCKSIEFMNQFEYTKNPNIRILSKTWTYEGYAA